MTKPISPLRQRVIDDMTKRNLSPSTHETYIRAVAQFSAFHRRSPDKLGVEHLREARADQGLVAVEPEGEANQDRRQGHQPWPQHCLPDGRGRHPPAMFREILRLIAELRPTPSPAPA